jgi:hypothetical protein
VQIEVYTGKNTKQRREIMSRGEIFEKAYQACSNNDERGAVEVLRKNWLARRHNVRSTPLSGYRGKSINTEWAKQTLFGTEPGRILAEAHMI